MSARSRLGALLAVAGPVVVVVCSALPWARSGRVDRSSYALVGVADRLDVLDGWQRTAAPIWYLLPALVAATWLAAFLAKPVVLATLSAVVAVLAIVALVSVVRSPLEVLAPARIAAMAGGVGLIGSILMISAARSRR